MPATHDSTSEERKILDLALQREKGILLSFETSADRTRFRQRLYQARKLDKQMSKDRYPIDHPYHNFTPYSELFFTAIDTEGGKFALLIKKGGVEAAGKIVAVIDLDTEQQINLKELSPRPSLEDDEEDEEEKGGLNLETE